MKTSKKLADITVHEVMTRKVQTLMATDTIKEAVAQMLEFELTTIPVIDSGNHCIGMISRSDLTETFLQEDSELSRAIGSEAFSTPVFNRYLDTCDVRQVQELMTQDVKTIRADQSVADACKSMARHRIHHLPVVDKNDCITGIVSAFDVVKAVAETA